MQVIPFLGVLNKYWDVYDSAERETLCNVVKCLIEPSKVSGSLQEHIKCMVEKCLSKHTDFQMLDLCTFLDADYKWDKLFELYAPDSAGDIPPIPEEERIQMEKLAMLKFTQKKIAKKAKDIQIFKLHQLVTATDHSGAKWVARVLDVYTDLETGRMWYYVHYENMDDSHNEWLCPPYRISKYSPMTARYYDPN